MEACPGLGTPAARGALAINGRPDAVFHQANGVDTRNDETISELNPRGPLPCCLRFTLPVARHGARLATGLSAQTLTGLDFHQLDSFERFPSAHVDFLLSQA